MRYVIWFSFIMILYIFLGYPLILQVISRLLSHKYVKKEIYPPVSLIISAYNEEDIIKEKILNSLNLDYPEDRLEIIVANDGSGDNTAEVVSKYPMIKLLDFEVNEGKTLIQNKAVETAIGEILVFSDANSLYRDDAIKRIVQNFADKSIGAVCGELILQKDKTNSGEGEGLYWKYEKAIKKAESNIASVLGNNGAIYALRRELYIPLPKDIISDFVEPLMIIKQGYRNVYEAKAIALEKPEGNFYREFNRKVRIITRGIRGMIYCRELLKLDFTGFALISHKILRWLAPIFMFFLFTANLFYHPGIYLVLLSGQLIFYLMALAGLKYEKKLLYIPTYFTIVNYASLVGIIHFITGRKYVSWETSKREF